jgi:hypothetical protein
MKFFSSDKFLNALLIAWPIAICFNVITKAPYYITLSSLTIFIALVAIATFKN